MRGDFEAFIILLAVVAPSSIGARTLTSRPPAHCRVVGEQKFLGAEQEAALCDEIERAIAAAAPTATYTAEVKTLSSTRLAATLVVDGRMLPVQNFAVMDDTLKPASMKRFADSIAREVLAATKPQ
jgi:hypothetical protein